MSASSIQNERPFARSTGKVRVARHLFETALGKVLVPVAANVGRHDDISYLRSPGPPVQVLPFEDGIERSADVKRQGMLLGSKKDDYLAGRTSETSDERRKRPVFLLRLVSW